MPARLVILAEEVLFEGGADASPGQAAFEALARLAHAGHPVAVILAGAPADGAAPHALQQLAHDAGGQVVAFFHRAAGDEDLTALLGEVVARWRVDPAQVHGVFRDPADLACVATFGATAVALAEPRDPAGTSPTGESRHADLGAFVDALLEDADPVA